MKFTRIIFTAFLGVALPVLPFLAVFGLLWSFSAAFAQGEGSGNLLTPGATAWFAAVAAVGILGAMFVRRAVAFALARSWLAWFAVGDRPIILSFAFALGWTLFMFQPGLLDIAAFKLLPAWQGILAVTVTIALGASGSVDSETQARKLEPLSPVLNSSEEPKP